MTFTIGLNPEEFCCWGWYKKKENKTTNKKRPFFFGKWKTEHTCARCVGRDCEQKTSKATQHTLSEAQSSEHPFEGFCVHCGILPMNSTTAMCSRFFLKSSIFSWTAFQQSSLVEALALVTSLSDYYTPIIIHPDYQQNPEYHNNRLLEPIIIWLLHNNRKTSLITYYYPIIITDYQCSEACCHASTLNVRCTCLFFMTGLTLTVAKVDSLLKQPV